MADGFGMKITCFNHTPRIARFLILAFGAVKMDEKMAITVNGDGNQRAVIFQGMSSKWGFRMLVHACHAWMMDGCTFFVVHVSSFGFQLQLRILSSNSINEFMYNFLKLFKIQSVC